MYGAERLAKLPKYLFAEIDIKVKEAKDRGIDLINLSIGDPDLPTPRKIVEKLFEAAKNPETHHYPSYTGMPEFRRAVSRWMKKRFNIGFGEDEILGLIGSKEGIAHLPLGILNPGDYALFPDPGYPVYKTSILFAGGIPLDMPLKEENDFKPDFNALRKTVREKKPKLMFLNYPNNPTGSTAETEFFKEVVEFASENNILICHDNAYSEMCFGDYAAPSIFQVENAKDTAIEIYSFSKTYNMTGWRIGFAVGIDENLKQLKKVKENFDSGIFNAIQIAAITALEDNEVEKEVKKNMKIFEERRDAVCDVFEDMNIEFKKPKATFYIWIKIKGKSIDFCNKAIEKGVVLTPGIGFGKYGEGYVRLAITQKKELIEKAARIIGKIYNEN